MLIVRWQLEEEMIGVQSLLLSSDCKAKGVLTHETRHKGYKTNKKTNKTASDSTVIQNTLEDVLEKMLLLAFYQQTEKNPSEMLIISEPPTTEEPVNVYKPQNQEIHRFWRLWQLTFKISDIVLTLTFMRILIWPKRSYSFCCINCTIPPQTYSA